MWGLFLYSQFCFMGRFIYPFINHCLDYCRFIVNLDIREYESFTFYLFQSLFSYFKPLTFHINFIISWLITTKNPAGILIEPLLNLWITLKTRHLNAVSSNPWTQYTSPSRHWFLLSVYCSFHGMYCVSFPMLFMLFVVIFKISITTFLLVANKHRVDSYI